MEFSYRISEAEYLRAAKLKLKGTFRFGRTRKTIMLWVVILTCFVLFYAIFQKHTQQQPIQDESVVQTVSPSQTVSTTILNSMPGVVVVATMAFLIFGLVPMQLRRVYRKDASMQGQFTINITPESISVQNTAGLSSKTGWNIYDYWSEGKSMILMVFQSGVAFPISLATLSAAQQNELRLILSAALPKK